MPRRRDEEEYAKPYATEAAVADVALADPPAPPGHAVGPGPTPGPGAGNVPVGPPVTHPGMSPGGAFSAILLLSLLTAARNPRLRKGVLVAQRTARFVNGVTPATPAAAHPFVGTGFTFVSAEDVLTNAWDSVDDSVAHDGSDGADVRRLTPTEGALWNQQTNAADVFYYGDGSNARAINGYPVYYTEADGFSKGMNSDVTAVAMLSGKEFEIIMVIRRLTDGDNKAVISLGSNRPANCRMYAGGVARVYGFLTSYVEANNADFTVGAHVLHIRFNNTTKKLQIAIDGGAFAEVAETADWAPDTGFLSLGLGNYAFACFGVYDGLYADYATLIGKLKTRFGIA